MKECTDRGTEEVMVDRAIYPSTGYNGKTWVDAERQGQPSKWVTLRAKSRVG